MVNKKKNSRYSALTLIVLLLAVLLYRIYKPEAKPPAHRRENPWEEPAPKHHKNKKEPAALRNLTVFTGKVTGIKDGDTFEVLYDSIPERVRLAEIDCPEKSQPFGKNAKQYASDLCFGKTVTVTSAGRDRYNRVIGTVITNDGINVNESLIKAGFAWHYKQYSKNTQLDVFEEQARNKHLGLWADDDPTPPWDWRKEKRTEHIR